jgi:dsDNA-specific endonuclease/ATPase MutS2
VSDDPAEPAEDFVLPIEDFIDLHPFRPREIRSVVESYLEEAARLGFSEVRLIHGRGIGVQRDAVRAVLTRNPLVRDFHDAPAERGGWGATVARLAPAVDAV